jgi:polar amino acid transport system substrate-binding protein
MALKLPGIAVILVGALICGLISIFPHPVRADDETTIVLNTTGNAPLNTPDQQGFVDLVATEAFRRIGVTVKTVKLPAERGLINANQGIHDGEMLRVGGLEKIYPNLIMVPEVSNVLLQMKADGSYQKIVDRILSPLKPGQ